MIDRSLNYGRPCLRRFLTACAPYDAVLDIGAGSGIDLGLAQAAAPEAALHAIEVHPPHVRALRERGIAAHPLNIERDPLPFPDGSLDVVIANQVLEHTKEIFWILHEVTRCLRTGGHLILGVPNLASAHNRLLLLLGRQPTPIQSNSAHVRGFTRGDLLAFLQSGHPDGYALTGFCGGNFYPFPPALARPLAAALPTLAWGIFLMLRKERDYKDGFLTYPVDRQLETNFYRGGE